jgi:hypothetical protein
MNALNSIGGMCPMLAGQTLPSLLGARVALGRTMGAGIALLLMTDAHAADVPPVGKPGMAPVVVSVTSNSGELSRTISITLSRLKPDWVPSEAADRDVLNGKPDIRYAERITVDRVAANMARDTALFVGALPEGDYDLERLMFSAKGGIQLPPNSRYGIGRFHSDGKTAIDLGRLVVTSVNEKQFFISRSSIVADNASLLRYYSPDQQTPFASGTVKGWISDMTGPGGAEQIALVQPKGFNRPALLSGGRIAAGARMGTVVIRQPDGNWRLLHNKSLATVMEVLPVEADGTMLYAGGEFSSLWRAGNGAQDLESLDAGNLPQGTVMFLAGSSKYGWYAALQSGNRIQFLRANSISQGDWKQLREEKMQFSYSSGDDKIWFWRTRHGMSYAMAHGGRIESLDFESGQWKTNKVPKDHNIIDIRSDEDGAMTALTSPGGGVGGFFAGVWESLDGGATWRTLKTPYSVNINVPLRLSENRLVDFPGGMGDGKLQLSNDGGANWEVTGPVGKTPFLEVLKSTVLLRYPDVYHFPTYEQVEISLDGGKTWQSTPR